MKWFMVLCVAIVGALALGVSAASAKASDSWSLSFTVTPTIAVGGDATFTGVLTNGGGQPVSGKLIDVAYYAGSGCEDYLGTWLGSDYPGDQTTDASGQFSFVVTFEKTGTWSFKAENGMPVVESGCQTLTVTAAATAPPPPPSGVFLCYSAFQTDPGVWPATIAPALMAQGYWSPYAVKGNVSDGTNVGGYHLVCNLAAGQAAGQQFSSGDGFVPGTDVFSALTGAPGWYPVVP